MSDDELRDAVIDRMHAWIEENLYKRSQILNTFGTPGWGDRHKAFVRDSGIRWDEALNVVGVRRVENHLRRPPRSGCIAFDDPFAAGPNSRRRLELTRDQALKIVTLGMP